MRYTFQEITSPKPNQVFQRSKQDKADIRVAGRIKSGGAVEFRLGDSGWQKAVVKDGEFSGSVKGVPVGGPYSVEVRVSGPAGESSSRKISGLLVGDLWLLAGQSNMDGYGKLVDLETPCSGVHAFYYNETWGIAKDPLCLLNESIDPVHWCTQDPVELEKAVQMDRDFRASGAGLGVRFGKDLYKATGVPVGLLMCSHGGTSLAQWNPDLKGEGGSSFYGSTYRRVGVAGGKVAGCLWYQGESDALNEVHGLGYKDQFRRLIESFRADMGARDMPFIYAQLGPFFNDDAACRDGWNRVQTDQLALESEMENVAMVAAIDATLSDCIHVDAVSQRRLGARMALLARKLRFGQPVCESGPRPSQISFVDGSRTQLRVQFTGVNGSLSPASGIRGFSVETAGGPLAIRKSVRDAKDASSVVLTLASSVPEGAELWYGRGISPVCNLSDAKGFTAPVFGPVKL